MTSNKNIFCLILVTLVLTVGFTGSDASAQTCFLTIEKSAPQDETQVFPFTIENAVQSGFSLSDAEDDFVTIPIDTTAVIVEERVGGWMLESVDCEDDIGMEITEIENGITARCFQPMQLNVGCTFNNVMVVRAIPTISEWGVLATVAGLGLAALFVMLRNKRRTV